MKLAQPRSPTLPERLCSLSEAPTDSRRRLYRTRVSGSVGAVGPFMTLQNHARGYPARPYRGSWEGGAAAGTFVKGRK